VVRYGLKHISSAGNSERAREHTGRRNVQRECRTGESPPDGYSDQVSAVCSMADLPRIGPEVNDAQCIYGTSV